MRLEIASVRANLLPMVILWGLAGAAVAAYYLMPGVAGVPWEMELSRPQRRVLVEGLSGIEK